jgi:hypothetical protein
MPLAWVQRLVKTLQDNRLVLVPLQQSGVEEADQVLVAQEEVEVGMVVQEPKMRLL